MSHNEQPSHTNSANTIFLLIMLVPLSAASFKEHWIGSHPNLVPCDLSPTNDITTWFHPPDNSSTWFHRSERNFEFAFAPRTSIEVDWFLRRNDHYRFQDQVNKRNRMRERFLLAGLLASFLFFYQTTPPNSSWIWDWYPDGEEWRQGVQGHLTERAVLQVLLKYP